MIQFLPFEIFHFVEIKLENNKLIYITSLSNTDLHKAIKNHLVFKGKVYKKREGLSKRGKLLNFIWFSRIED